MAERDLLRGLVGYWRFEEQVAWDGTADEVQDSSGLGNHGVAKGTIGLPSINTAGKLGRCGDFTRASGHYIEVATAASLRPLAISIAGWVNLGTSTDNYPIMASTAGGFGEGWMLQYNHAETVFKAVFWNGTAVSVLLSSVINPNNTDWYHCVITHAATGCKFYVNGEFQAEKADAVLPTLASEPVMLGKRGATADFYDGLLDETAIWNRVLSADEVRHLYNGGQAYHIGSDPIVGGQIVHALEEENIVRKI